MSKIFRAWDVDREWVLPASLHQFVPQVIWRISCAIRRVGRWSFPRSRVPESQDRVSRPIYPGILVTLLP